jgi:pSer/pThr/pTyr-binding forkhead associated (FHA) protein
MASHGAETQLNPGVAPEYGLDYSYPPLPPDRLVMPAHLLSLTDGPSILIDKPILLFGRHAECDVQLNSKKVSRRHCVLAQVSDYLVIRDLGSTNGIRINGKKHGEGNLHPGDELTIGNFRYQVCGDVLGRLEPQLDKEMKELREEAAERMEDDADADD